MAVESFTIPYPTTPEGRKKWNKEYGTNAYYAGKHWAKRREDAEYWHAMTRHYMRERKVRTRPFNRPVTITFYWNDRLDLSNHAVMAKMIEDAMKGVLIKDDSRKYIASIRHCWHTKNYIGVVVEEV